MTWYLHICQSRLVHKFVNYLALDLTPSASRDSGRTNCMLSATAMTTARDNSIVVAPPRPARRVAGRPVLTRAFSNPSSPFPLFPPPCSSRISPPCSSTMPSSFGAVQCHACRIYQVRPVPPAAHPAGRPRPPRFTCPRCGESQSVRAFRWTAPKAADVRAAVQAANAAAAEARDAWDDGGGRGGGAGWGGACASGRASDIDAEEEEEDGDKYGRRWVEGGAWEPAGGAARRATGGGLKRTAPSQVALAASRWARYADPSELQLPDANSVRTDEVEDDKDDGSFAFQLPDRGLGGGRRRRGGDGKRRRVDDSRKVDGGLPTSAAVAVQATRRGREGRRADPSLLGADAAATIDGPPLWTPRQPVAASGPPSWVVHGSSAATSSGGGGGRSRPAFSGGRSAPVASFAGSGNAVTSRTAVASRSIRRADADGGAFALGGDTVVEEETM